LPTCALSVSHALEGFAGGSLSRSSEMLLIAVTALCMREKTRLGCGRSSSSMLSLSMLSKSSA
jgi:hypothetical protein